MMKYGDIKEIERKILSIISCGKLFDKDIWICGDFLGEDRDEDGRSFGRHYYCEKCHKKADEILELIKQKIEVEE